MMRKLLLVTTVLTACALGGITHRAQAGACSPGGNTICNQPPAVNIQPTDLVEVWQFDQTPGTRSAPLSSIGAGGGGGGGDPIFNSLVMQSNSFQNINDGSPNYAYLGVPPDASYQPGSMQIAGGLTSVTFPYGEDGLGINLLLLSNPTSQFPGAWGSFITGGVQQLATYLNADEIGEANEVDPSPPLMTLQVSAYSGAIILTTTAETKTTDPQPNVLHFGPGNVPRCIIQPVGVVGLNIPTTGAVVGFPNTTVIAVDYVAGDVTLSNNVSGTIPAGTALTFGAGRANLTTPLTTAQLSLMRRYMTVETLGPHVTSLVSTWDPNGAWIETIGWAANGNAAFGQIPTNPTLYVGYHNNYFTRNTIVVTCDPIGDPTCNLTANGSLGDEVDVVNTAHFYDPSTAPSAGGINIFAFESTGLSPAADTGLTIAGPFESAFLLGGIAQSGYYITARNDGGLGQGSTTGQLNWIVSAFDGSQVIGNLGGTPSSPCFSMATVGGGTTGQHDIDLCGGFGNVGAWDAGFAFLHAGALEIINPDQAIDNLAANPNDGNSLVLVPGGPGLSAAISTDGDAAGQITIVPNGGAVSGQLTLSAQVFVPPVVGAVAYSVCGTTLGQLIMRAGVNCY